MKNILLWLLEATTREEYYKTGTRAVKSGLYRSGKEIIPLAVGEKFPPSVVNSWWILVVSV